MRTPGRNPVPEQKIHNGSPRVEAYVPAELRLAVLKVANRRSEESGGTERVTLSKIVIEALEAHPQVAEELAKIKKERG